MEFLDKLDNEKTHSKVEILKQICRDAAPLVNLFQSKEDYKQELIRKLEKKNLQNCAKREKAEKVEKYKEHFNHEVPQSTKSNARNSSYSFGRDLDLLTFFEQDSALFSFKEKERVCSFYSCQGWPSYNSSRKYWNFPAEKAQQSPFERC